LGFGNYLYYDDGVESKKANYIVSTSSPERKYLSSVFDGVIKNISFHPALECMKYISM